MTAVKVSIVIAYLIIYVWRVCSLFLGVNLCRGINIVIKSPGPDAPRFSRCQG